MKTSRWVGLGLATGILAAAAVSPAFAGGWAVVTLDSQPEGVEPGVAFSVGFTVRQHGVTPLSNLDPAPELTAKSAASGAIVRSTAAPDGGPGHYTAEMTLPASGEWDWGIRAFGDQVQPMPRIVVAAAAPAPLRAPAPSTPAVALGVLSAVLAAVGIFLAFRRRLAFSGVAILLSAITAGLWLNGVPSTTVPAEAAAPPHQAPGEVLFVAKGCVMCHLNESIPQSRSISLAQGPDLSAYSNDPGFLARWLADPQELRPGAEMPDLGLSDDEIEALIAFLNEDSDA